MARSPLSRDLALWVALAAAVMAESWPRWGLVAAGIAWSGLVTVTVRRWPAWALAIGAAANLVPLAEPPDAEIWPVLVSATAGLLAGRRMADTRVAAAVFAGVAAAGLVVAVAAGDVWAWFPVGFLVVLWGVLPWLAGRFVRMRATLAAAGWQRAEQLERERLLVEREVRLRERTRIARDMHDSLGHDLSLMAMQAGALELDGDLAERHRAAIGDLRSASVDATDRLQEIIGVLRDTDEPAPVAPVGESVAELVARSRASGLGVDLVRSGTGTVPPVLDRTVYRVVQEALTNAVKHAPGASVAVRIAVDGTRVRVAVVNGAPTGRRPAAARGGTGLPGLRERVRLVGGSLRHGDTADGYEVVAELPFGGPPGTTGAGASDSALHRADVTRAARRGMAAAVALPVAIGAVVVLTLLGLRWYEVTHSFLAADTYDALRVGEPVTGTLPPDQVDGRPRVPEPPVPHGARCEYYRVTRDMFTGPVDVYRLCFVDGRLVDKTVVPGTTR